MNIRNIALPASLALAAFLSLAASAQAFDGGTINSVATVAAGAYGIGAATTATDGD